MYISVLAIISITTLVSSEVIVETKLGNVRGTVMLSRNGAKFNAFLALPYAKPPIGELRFKVSTYFFQNYTFDVRNRYL